MKPLKLFMNAFGPYAKETSIDFRELDQGVYLITGDTGAGKTTIFDSIVFALYGEGSGSGRNSEMFHSDYVDKFTDTTVELEFSCGEKEYRVVRTIHYKKKRGGGVGTIAKQAVLYCPGELPIEKETAVNQKVTEILGLDEKQFRQIVMLAQGEFRKFLESKSDAREQILGKLFDHRIYVEFQNRLKSAADQLRKEREEKEREIGFHLNEFTDTEQLKLQIEILTEERKQVGETLACENQALTQMQERLQVLREYCEKAEEAERMGKRLEMLCEQIEKAQVKCGELEAERAENQKLLPVIDQYKIRMTELNRCLEEFETIEILEKNCMQLFGEMEVSKRKIGQISEKTEQIKAELIELQKQFNEFDQVDVNLAKAEHQLEKEDKRKQQIEELFEKVENLKSQELKYHREKQKLFEKNQNFEKASSIYIEKNRMFLAGQAGVLAKELEMMVKAQGSASCPVCGTVVKEMDSQFSKTSIENVPTQEQVESAREASDAAQKEAADCAKKCEVLKNTIEFQKNEMLVMAEPLLNMPDADWEHMKDPGFMDQILSLTESEVSKKALQVAEWKKKQTQKKVLEKRVADNQKNLESGLESLEQNKNTLRNHETSYAVKKREMETIQNKLTAASKEAAKEEQHALQTKKNRMEAKIQETEDSYGKIRMALGNLQGEQKILLIQNEDIGNKLHCMREKNQWIDGLDDEKQVLVSLKNKILEHETRKAELENKREQQLVLLEKCKDAWKNIGKLREELDKTKEAYERLWNLSALANGQAAEGGKYSFSRYVLGTFFEEIIDQANYHLNQMTGGKYELIRKQEADRKNESAGLGMVIYDAYTGEVRDTASLSGGESFQVSLSLALGLSDVVRSRSGGYALETMFIDEGFGSLDEQALDQAMKVLHELSGDSRQIGIISHVGKLSESIAQKIYVRRSPRGSSIEILK